MLGWELEVCEHELDPQSVNAIKGAAKVFSTDAISKDAVKARATGLSDDMAARIALVFEKYR
jgi:hypothetical protein